MDQDQAIQQDAQADIRPGYILAEQYCKIGHPLEVYYYFRNELEAQYIQFIPIVERVTPETLPMANMGWSERPGGDRLLYTQTGNLVTDLSVNAGL